MVERETLMYAAASFSESRVDTRGIEKLQSWTASLNNECRDSSFLRQNCRAPLDDRGSGESGILGPIILLVGVFVNSRGRKNSAEPKNNGGFNGGGSEL